MQIVNSEDFDQRNQHKMDEQLLVRFYLKPKQDNRASEEQGRPVFVDAEYIEIRIPGSRDAVARPAKPADIARFPKHYEAFKNRTAIPETGTPLVEWPLISRSVAEELSFYNVKTVEQLIAMSDQNASQFMGINTLKAKAKEWLETATTAAEATKLADELAKRDSEIEELKAAVKKLTAAPVKKTSAKKKATRKKVSAKKE